MRGNPAEEMEVEVSESIYFEECNCDLRGGMLDPYAFKLIENHVKSGFSLEKALRYERDLMEGRVPRG